RPIQCAKCLHRAALLLPSRFVPLPDVAPADGPSPAPSEASRVQSSYRLRMDWSLTWRIPVLLLAAGVAIGAIVFVIQNWGLEAAPKRGQGLQWMLEDLAAFGKAFAESPWSAVVSGVLSIVGCLTF